MDYETVIPDTSLYELLANSGPEGGHVAFLSYEIVSGRKSFDKFSVGDQKVGMVLSLTLLTFNKIFLS